MFPKGTKNRLECMTKRLAVGIIFVFSLINYIPALWIFLSHDDFFWLRVSNPKSLWEFASFFNPFVSANGFGFYRPLSSQTYFYLGILFDKSPFVLHLISLLAFFLLVLIVYKLSLEILKNDKAALFSAVFYATSSVNLVKIYWPAIFQETCVNIFLLGSTLLFMRRRYGLSLLTFVMALMSKESAVILPGLLILVSGRQIFKSLRPFLFSILILGIYLYAHFFHYGVVSGDSYIWSFSPKVINTAFWYGLWSFNIPESLVDFIGPGFHMNPNLLKYFALDLIPVSLMSLGLIWATVVLIWRRGVEKFLFLGLLWFLVALSPVIFLPWHKQSYELGTSLFGLCLVLGFLISKGKKAVSVVFIVVWILTAFWSNHFTIRNHWVMTGAKEASRVYKFVSDNKLKLEGKTIIFYDTEADTRLPWLPSSQLKLDLSNQDFFRVYYPKIYARYGKDTVGMEQGNIVKVEARQFLGY